MIFLTALSLECKLRREEMSGNVVETIKKKYYDTEFCINIFQDEDIEEHFLFG
jgi:hypothetical protein